MAYGGTVTAREDGWPVHSRCECLVARTVDDGRRSAVPPACWLGPHMYFNQQYDACLI